MEYKRQDRAGSGDSVIQLEFGPSYVKTTRGSERIQSVLYEDTLHVKRE